jgi:hypothetical protein
MFPAFYIYFPAIPASDLAIPASLWRCTASVQRYTAKVTEMKRVSKLSKTPLKMLKNIEVGRE